MSVDKKMIDKIENGYFEIKYLEDNCTSERIADFDSKISNLDTISKQLAQERRDDLLLPSIIDTSEKILMVAEECETPKNKLLIILTSFRILYLKVNKQDKLEYDNLPLNCVFSIIRRENNVKVKFDNNDEHFLYIHEQIDLFIKLARYAIINQTLSQLDGTIKFNHSDAVAEVTRIVGNNMFFITCGVYDQQIVLMLSVDKAILLLGNLDSKIKIIEEICLSKIDYLSYRISGDYGHIDILNRNKDCIIESVKRRDCIKMATVIYELINTGCEQKEKIALSEVNKQPAISAAKKEIQPEESTPVVQTPTKNETSEPVLGIADEIAKLLKLQKDGVISEEEFAAAKKKVLKMS